MMVIMIDLAVQPFPDPGPPADPDVARSIMEARAGRAVLAAKLVEGSCDLSLLTMYRDNLTTSRLLGDISEEEAQASYDRACNVYAANCGRAYEPPS